MTVQDMDICLNISTGPAGNASKKNNGNDDDSLFDSIRKMKSQSFGGKKTKDKTQTKNVSTKQIVKPVKRIKQKSLLTIVNTKLNQANMVRQSQSVPKKLNVQSKEVFDKNKNVAQNVIKAPVKLSETKPDASKSSISASNETSTEPILSFAKITKEIAGKTLLAKKRNLSDVNSKKTLSDIFSKSNESTKTVSDVFSKLNEPKNTEVNLLASNEKVDTDEYIPNKKRKFVEPQKPFHNAKRTDFDNRKGKRYKNRSENQSESKSEHDTNPRFQYRPGGKIAPLFGHNPEIPNIGQRFVRPIDEPVFTCTNFEDIGVHPFTISNLEQNMSITKMTTVQQKAIPQIFSGKDILIRSQTGSGKTLAYALPIVELLHKIRPKLSRNSGLSALVVVPTRELALQTYECFLKLVKPFTWIVPGYLSGGEKRKAEKARLRKGCNILVGTPGRLLDHIKHTEALKLEEVKYFVLDEADRMFDMGYEKDISGIVSALKVATPQSKTGYDAMQMLRQNVNKVFTDDEANDLENDETREKTEESQKQLKDDENIESDGEQDKPNADENTTRRAYHSSSDSETEEGEPSVKSKKSQKQKSGEKKVARTELSVTETNTEEDKDETDPADRSRRQTILLSATLTQAVEKLAGLAMENPVFVDAAKENLESVGGDMTAINEDLVVPQSVVQSYIITPPKLRMVTLSAYIAGKCKSSGQHKIFIFMATQDMVDYHTEILSSVLTKPMDEDDEDSDPLVDVEFFKLHGNMTQKERTDVFKTFRQAKSGVLLCTDVAARGLDMPKVDCVIQYTGPLSARDYVHRIGRTARAGSSGSATIFLTPPEIEFVRMLESRRIRIKQENMDDVLNNLMGPLSRHHSVQASAIALQDEFEKLVIENNKLREKAYKAYTSWVRFYTSYPRDMREIFNRKELHLGHYAKSFALRDPPQRIGGIGKSLHEKDNSKRQHNNRLSNERPDGVPQKKQRVQDGGTRVGLLKKVRMLNTSEYGSGLEPVKKPKKS